NVSLGSGCNGLQNRLFVDPRASHDDAEVGAGGLQAGHNVKQVLAGTAAQQGQIDPLKGANVGPGWGTEFKGRFGIKKGPEAHEPQLVALDYGNSDERLFRHCSFHQQVLGSMKLDSE